MYKGLITINYMPIQLMVSGDPVIRVIRIRRRKKGLLPIILLIITFVTVWLTGLALSQGYYEIIGASSTLTVYLWSLLYAIIFLIVLGSHEYGHILASRKYSIPISGPYFIPAPPAQLGFIGTLGSLISMEGLPPNRRSLILLGLSGPLAGFLAGLVFSIIGIQLSEVLPSEEVKELIMEGKAEGIPFMPLILIFLTSLRGVGEGSTLLIHPIAFVGFVIFLVTFINLMPIGQLDGGHVVRAFTSAKTHNFIGYLVIILLIIVGLLTSLYGGSYIYFMIAIILGFFKMVFGSRLHPGPANGFSKLEKKDHIYLLIYITLVIATMPIPIM